MSHKRNLSKDVCQSLMLQKDTPPKGYTFPGLPSLLTGEHTLPCHERDSLQGCLAGPELSCKHQVPQVPQVPQSSPASLHKSQSLTTNPLNRKAPIKTFQVFQVSHFKFGKDFKQRTTSKNVHEGQINFFSNTEPSNSYHLHCA